VAFDMAKVGLTIKGGCPKVLLGHETWGLEAARGRRHLGGGSGDLNTPHSFSHGALNIGSVLAQIKACCLPKETASLPPPKNSGA
jgi:hypothetical protein